MKRLLVIDANSLIHRAYHALPPLTGPKGEPTGAIYGFTSMVVKALRELRPDYVAAAFDLKGPTFRHEEYKAYKATRPPTPENLAPQLEKSKEILEAFRIPVLGVPGFEADDIIGTLAAAADRNPDLQTVVLSGDLDVLQLATDRVKISTPKKGISDVVTYDRRAVTLAYGFAPELLADYKALRGDPSDNIPGVPGIGEKTASSLVAKFGAIENLYAALERPIKDPLLTKRLREKLLAGKANAFLSKSLASIRRDAPVETDVSAYASDKISKERTEQLFNELGFKTLIPRVAELCDNIT